jgi:hypothetical protein
MFVLFSRWRTFLVHVHVLQLISRHDEAETHSSPSLYFIHSPELLALRILAQSLLNPM